MDFFSSDGVRIAYLDVVPASGSGDPVVLVHGFASNHAVNWVNTLWVKALGDAGYRVIALDNRGHGRSDKLYRPEDYHTEVMADDVRRLLDHLGIGRADVMGYSMGARITAFLALRHPERVRSAMLGGLGSHLVEGVGLPLGIADAMRRPRRTRCRIPCSACSGSSRSRPRATSRPSRRASAARARFCRATRWGASRSRSWCRSAPRTRSPARPTILRRLCRMRARSTSRA